MPVDLSPALEEAAVRACWPVFAQLRPQLASEEEFIARWRTQREEGYRILRADEAGTILGAAGFRILHTMAWGRILYLDDLIVDEAARGTGLGRRLLATLKEIARDADCDQVHLDTGYQRHAAHRAYLRAGFHLDCHHLALSLRES